MSTITLKNQSEASVPIPATGEQRVFLNSDNSNILSTKDDAGVVRPSGVGTADELATTGSPVDVSAAAPPTAGQLLKATGATTATWQDGADAVSTTGAAVDVAAAAPPTAGQVLTATGATAATWQDPSGGGGDTNTDATVQTTDATVTTIATYTTLANERAIDMRVRVWSREAATDDSAKYVIEALFNRDGGGVVTSKDENFISVFEDQPAWDVTFNISGSDIQVQVTGEAAKTIEWRCKLEVNEHG